MLDFIGNYKRPTIYLSFGRHKSRVHRPVDTGTTNSIKYPPGCLVQFDFRLINLFEEMAKRDPLQKRMRDDFVRLKDRLGRRPWRFDMYEGSDIPMRNYLQEGWLQFLGSVDALTDEEKTWLGKPVEEFLKELEKTSMTKSYKIPTINSLITDDNNLSMSVPLDIVGERFQEYYVTSKQHQQDLHDRSNRDWAQWTLRQFTSLARETRSATYPAASSFTMTK